MLMQTSELLDSNDPLLTMADAVADLNAQNLKISKSWFEKLHCAGDGPKVDTYWGRRPMWKRSTVRSWALERMQQSRAA